MQQLGASKRYQAHFTRRLEVLVKSQLDSAPRDQVVASNGEIHTCSRHTLIECDRAHPRRGELERYVREAFAAKHAADVKSFMPTLLALQGREGRVCGVTGYRHAGCENLFLEQYLDQPVQHAISAVSGVRVTREQIVEVGNLASLRCRAAVHLVALLPQYLVENGREWVVFTATQSVRHILQAFRAPLYELAPARAECIASSNDRWGEYYQADPRVMAGYLPDGFRLARFRKSPRS